MAFDEETLRKIHTRTAGRCHLCWKQVCFANYANAEGRGGWEVEHSNPQAKGGTHHGNNLYPACIPCNRAKGTMASRTVRRWHGRTKAPMSKEQQEAMRQSNALVGLAIGSFMGLVASRFIVPPPNLSDENALENSRPSLTPIIVSVVIGAIIVAIIAYNARTE